MKKNKEGKESLENIENQTPEKSLLERFLKEKPKIVIKIGTSSISTNEGLNRKFMNSVAEQVSCLLKEGCQVIIVSSGAIGLGMDRLNLKDRPNDLYLLQALASNGQRILMEEWGDVFEKYNLEASQMLLTYKDFSDKRSYLNVRNAFHTLLNHNYVPIVNENDVTCLGEVEKSFGDNDKLSAIIASKIEADILIILSDIDGLYDKDPKKNKDAKLISVVKEITPEIEKYGGSPTSIKGTGGMKTKINAGKICNRSGCYMAIINNNIENGIIRILKGEKIGTLFLTDEEVCKRKNEKEWIRLAKSFGRVIVDNSTKNVLINKGSILLPIGITKIVGKFNRGDIIEIECDGVFAKGITEYSSSDLEQIKGIHMDEVPQILNIKTSYKNIISKDNLVLFNKNK